MPAVTYNNKRSGCYLGETASLNIVNEEIIIASGNGVLDAGTIISKITASGKYGIADPAGAGGLELPANVAILFHSIDATAADVKTVGTVRGPATISEPYLTYKAAMTAPNKTAIRNSLRAKGLAVLPQHAGE